MFRRLLSAAQSRLERFFRFFQFFRFCMERGHPVRFSFLALTAFFCVTVFTGCGSTDKVAGRHIPWPGHALFSKKKFSKGATLHPSDVEVRPVAEEQAPLDALCEPAEVDDAVACGDIEPGDFITMHIVLGAKAPISSAACPALAKHEQGSLVVATHTIQSGRLLLPEDIETITAPKNRCPVDCFTSADEVIGQRTEYLIPAYTVLSVYAIRDRNLRGNQVTF